MTGQNITRLVNSILQHFFVVNQHQQLSILNFQKHTGDFSRLISSDLFINKRVNSFPEHLLLFSWQSTSQTFSSQLVAKFFLSWNRFLLLWWLLLVMLLKLLLVLLLLLLHKHGFILTVLTGSVPDLLIVLEIRL